MGLAKFRKNKPKEDNYINVDVVVSGLNKNRQVFYPELIVLDQGRSVRLSHREVLLDTLNDETRKEFE